MFYHFVLEILLIEVSVGKATIFLDKIPLLQ